MTAKFEKERQSENKVSKNKSLSGTKLSEEILVKVGVHQGSVLSPLLFANMVDVVTESSSEGLMNLILYTDDWVLMAHTRRT